MNKTLLSAVILIVFIRLPLHAQSEGNPFKSLGYEASVATFSDYEEFHDQSHVVQIGSVWFDTDREEIVGFVQEKDTLIELVPDLISTSIDPHCEKYYSISPYAYCFNNPVRFVDPDGRDPRIYVENKGLGHAFVTTGAGENTTVYTYGRYGELGKDKSSARSTSLTGEGVLIKLTGEEAKAYIKDQIFNKEATVFEFVGGSDDKVSKHFNNLLETNSESPSIGKYANNENAKVIDKYNLIDNNCVTTSVNGVQEGVAIELKPLQSVKGPAALESRLNTLSSKYNDIIKVISPELIIKDLNLNK